MLIRQSYQLRLLIAKLNQRERYLMLIVIAAVILAASQLLIMSLGLNTHDDVRQRIDRAALQTQALEQALVDYQAAINNPRILTLKNNNSDLQQRIDQLESRIADINSQLMTPERMISLLKDLLNNKSTLTLLRFEVLPVETIESNGGGDSLFYKHGLTIQLEGQFEALTDYLAAIESLNGELFWDNMIIETERFPTLNIQLEVHTMSLDEEWLNV